MQGRKTCTEGKQFSQITYRQQESQESLYIFITIPTLVRLHELNPVPNTHSPNRRQETILFAILEKPCQTNLPYNDICWELLAVKEKKAEYLMFTALPRERELNSVKVSVLNDLSKCEP